MIRVRMRSRELDPTPQWADFPTADTYYIHDDHTLELRDEHGDPIAHVHHDRWELVLAPGALEAGR